MSEGQKFRVWSLATSNRTTSFSDMGPAVSIFMSFHQHGALLTHLAGVGCASVTDLPESELVVITDHRTEGDSGPEELSDSPKALQ